MQIEDLEGAAYGVGTKQDATNTGGTVAPMDLEATLDVAADARQ